MGAATRSGKNATLGHHVRALRRAAGRRREDIAVASGLSLTTVRRVEGDQIVPTRASVRCLAAALGVPEVDLESLVDRTPRPVTPTSITRRGGRS